MTDATTAAEPRGFRPSRRSFLQIAAALGAAAALAAHTEPAHATPSPSWPTGRPGVLVDETFAFMVDFDPRGLSASGWELRALAGTIRYAFGTYMRPTDTRSDLGIGLYRPFRPVTDGTLTWDFRFEPITAIDGATFALTTGDARDALTLAVVDGDLVCLQPDGPLTLATVTVPGVHGVRVQIDVAAQTADIIVNGTGVATGVTVDAPDGLTGVHYRTGAAQTADLYLGPIRVAVNQPVWEDFATVPTGSSPDRWTTTGTLAIVSANHSRRADNYCARLTGTGAVAARTVHAGLGGDHVFETSFLATSMPGGLVIRCTAGDGRLIRLRVASSQLTIDNAASTAVRVSYVNYANTIWHHVRVVVTGGVAQVWHNGKQRLTGLALPTSGEDPAVEIELPNGGTVAFDDVKLYPWLGYPADYVPEPQPVSTGSHVIGMQSCNLWREGYHRGWDVINPHRERWPVLGFYDEGLPEVADWETKWFAENGVTFQMYCWYRPQGGKGTPIKMPRLGMHLHEGYFPSRWSQYAKFVIQWENSGEPTDSTDFRRHLVPFWLEYYFKDPRYLKVDNKPVLAIYSLARLIEYFGSAAAARAELDHLDSVCVAAGFDGVTVIGNAAANQPALELDAEYSYSRKGYADVQKTGMEQRRALGTIDVLATVAHGRNDLAWNDRWGEYATPEVFRDVLQWTKDTYMPAAPADALSRRVALLTNWNEYGEGHFLFPSALAGFGYLEAVRDVFGTSAGPANTMPTAAQVDRVTVLYPQGRVLPDAATAEPTVAPEVALEWTFETDGDLLGWGDLHGTIGDLRAEGGVLAGTATTNDPVVTSPDDLGIVAADHPFIRVRLRTDVTSEQEVFFIQPDNTTYSRERGLVFHAAPDADGWVDAIVPMWRSPHWQGVISQFRIDPMVLPGEFEIASVQVLRAVQAPPHVVVNGLRRTGLAPVVSGAEVLLPALPLLQALNRRAEWDSTTGTLRALNGSELVEATVGERTGRQGTRRFPMRVATRVDEHGWPLVPMSFFEHGMGATSSWTGTLLTLDVPPPPPRTIRVAPSGGDFTGIAAAVASITDSGAQRPYVIEVAPGTYTDTEWTVPPFTTIRGDDRDTCVLAGALGDDATDAQISGTSTLWLKQTATLENLTISAANMRYAVHSESSGANVNATHTVRNCRIVHSGNDGARNWRRANPGAGLSPSTVWSSDRPWGYGSASGLHLEITDCELVGVKEPWYIHTNKDFAAPTVNVLERCTFTHTGGLAASTFTVQSLGSGQQDEVTVRDSTFTGVYLRHDDRPWISERPAAQTSDHAETLITLDGCSPLGFRPNLRSRALRLVAVETAADAPISVTGGAAPLLFGDPVARTGGGGVPAYLYGSWDISGILVGLSNNVTVANTIGRRLGNRTGDPLDLVVTVGSAAPVTITFDADHTAATNATLLAAIGAALAGVATVEEYDVGLGETYPAVGDKEARHTNTGTVAIPRWAVVSLDGDGVRLRGSGPAYGVALEQLAPGVPGRILRAGVLWRQQLAGLTGTEVAAGTDVFLDEQAAGQLAVTGTSVFGSAVITDWVTFDLR